MSVTKRLKRDDRDIKIEMNLNNWCDVIIDGQVIAKTINEEEARRLIWLELNADGENIEFVDDGMFEVV